MSVTPKSFADIFNSGSWEGQQNFTDRTLQANDGTTFRIHRVVLTQRSGFFRALFDFNMNQETTVIPNIDRKILKCILVYIYMGTIALDEKNVCGMMTASDYLLLDDLLKICESFASENMTSANCLPILTAAWQMNRLAMYEGCCRYALVHFTDILETSYSGLEELPFEILIKLLESKSFNVISERSVWKAIISWTEGNTSIRLPHVPALLTCLRLQEETDEELIAEILSHTIVSNNPHIFGLILSNEFNFYRIQRTVHSQHASSESLCKKLPYLYDPRMPNRLHLIARNTCWGSELLLTYDKEFDFGRRIEEARSFVDMMLQIGKHIYIFNQRIVVDIFDIIEEAWVEREVPPMPSDDGWTITLREKLYHFDFRNLSIYEFERNRWEIITTVHDIIITGVVTLKDQIFIVGTFDDDEDAEVMMCQTYDPEKNTWISLPAPNIYREHILLAVYHEQVFLIPADHYAHHPKKIEVYVPNQNTWISLPDLPFQYQFTGAVIVDDKILVYEDNEESRRRFQKVDPPVYWDDGAQIWRIVDESSPWFHIERYSVLRLDDYSIVKDLTAKNKCPENEWERIFLV
ncbi:Kelch-like protein 17 [Araneus ventricosus]|uniref:Kelch-like protein 17 n=1 Tax=Araneus ventricosus TaxID=182803 RepID=A0A4Y2NK47_ARAVE|nr:Kelch-like protein 17 [Araneus ventricosus]